MTDKQPEALRLANELEGGDSQTLYALSNEATACLRAQHATITAQAARIAELEGRGEVVVTKNYKGQIVAVTRQDDEGRILSVLAESAAMQQGEQK